MAAGAVWTRTRQLQPTVRAGARQSTPGKPAPRGSARRGGLDVTFLATADTHFGVGAERDDPDRDALLEPRGIEKTHQRGIAAMNHIGGLPLPRALGGRVSKPLGVLVAGDLTEDGRPEEWRWFEQYFGLTGQDGLVRFPVFEGQGNHDKHDGWHVRGHIERRHGARYYGWDWGDLYVACLGEGPDESILKWLKDELKRVGTQRPVIVYFHFPLLGPYSTGHWFAKGDYRRRLKRTLDGHNVIAIIHGHYHASAAYRWNGYDIVNVGSAKHGWHSFAVVHVTDDALRIASYNYTEKRFWWWFSKPINGAVGRRVSGTSKGNVGTPDVRL